MSTRETMAPKEFEKLYQLHHSWLRNLLFHLLGNNEDAADLAQDAFIRLWHRPKTLDTTQQVRAYLRVIARGLCVDLWRRRQVEQAWLDTLANHPDIEAPSTEHQVTILQALTDIDHMLISLPKNVSKAFTLSVIQGKTGKEIANELSVSERMVRHYLSNSQLNHQLTTYAAIA
ncbi:sigma-70 family RNA polymerase sigma factor [Neptunomonas phycophila]|uniref:Sigma-70 family RNA polymerase sigma factor n=1 Tax=Neptunomonas phycophila TaxID=1572645 RepID=A0AAW7XG31_9GAMM|nr:sigma-70 family RNA polymerase sigma factor [Neptunomonas phycophila]MDO6453171.1 sigma-70 family RNA polymerase sigma factor [Neptunomonas phycophila]MDO6469280.1 sigma-70 family RNA polymerase sigma factor [Neptunomonas phycophila]